jgi:polyribonucleotide nucleotidyltransferase
MRARDAESLELAQKFIREALEKADGITHIGYMAFPDRGTFPRIIGSKGSVIDSLSMESGAEIIVPKDDVTIKIYGAFSSSCLNNALIDL